MNYITPLNLRLPARNEGKIKAYESCSDVRAWSHDNKARDRYLREWMKGDMTVCFTPVTTLIKFLRTMTVKSRGKATPRCHPDCKSKLILESICTSCDAMKECLKSNHEFQKYFDEEEFETCHWPCERCMDALKNIKLFWKVIVEKLLNLNLLKNEDLKDGDYSHCDNVRSAAKQWQEDIIQQTNFIKALKPIWNKASFLKNNDVVKCDTVGNDKEVAGTQDEALVKNVTVPKTVSYTIKTARATDTSSLSSSAVKKTRKRTISHSRKANKMTDKCCETCIKEEENKELVSYKNNFLELQQKFCAQQDEVDILRRENDSLKIELQNLYKQYSCKCFLYSSPSLRNKQETIDLIPKPFETCTEQDANPPTDIDSEMIITMKKCKNESYRHVSLLQVLHKSNGPIYNDSTTKGSYCQKENPINVLERVQNTFGEIVRREMMIANEKDHRLKKIDIDASFHRMNASKSAPSCSTMLSSSSSDMFKSSWDKKTEIIHE